MPHTPADFDRQILQVHENPFSDGLQCIYVCTQRLESACMPHDDDDDVIAQVCYAGISLDIIYIYIYFLSFHRSCTISNVYLLIAHDARNFEKVKKKNTRTDPGPIFDGFVFLQSA